MPADIPQKLTNDERQLLGDFKDTGFRYVGTFPPPEIIRSLTQRGLLEWHPPRAYASRGEVIFSVTDAGRSALASNRESFE